jgi:tRNA modification GTPase
MAQVLAIRVHVEAAIDFADESLDTLGGEAAARRLDEARPARACCARPQNARPQACAMACTWCWSARRMPARARCSTRWPAASAPSSPTLAGTTRDLLQETIRIDGVELTLVDTAGLREAFDAIEAEGIRRARAELAARRPGPGRAGCARPRGRARWPWRTTIAGVPQRLWLHNKADLLLMLPGLLGDDALAVSARTGAGTGGPAPAPARPVRRRRGDRRRLYRARAPRPGTRRRGRATGCAQAGELRRERLELAAEALAQAHDSLGDDRRAGRRGCATRSHFRQHSASANDGKRFESP